MQKKKTKKGAKSKVTAKPRAGRSKKSLGEVFTPIPAKKSAGGGNNKDRDKIVLAALALGAAGVVGYLGYDLFLRKKQYTAKNGSSDSSENSNPNTNPIPIPIPGATTYVSDSVSSGSNHRSNKNENETNSGTFPLRRGSKGAAVKKVQQAIIAKYGPEMLPKYGADGDFGPEMAGALKKLGLPPTISKSAYEVLIQGVHGASAGAGASDTAEQLHNAAQSGDLKSVLALLRTMSGKDDYRSVSDAFKQLRTDGVRQTLVNGLLNSFSDEGQKQQIRYEFLRMGLLYNGSQWSLSGTDVVRLITHQPTRIWASTDRPIWVPQGRILGRSLATRDGYTLFENNEKLYLVKTEDVTTL